MKCNICSYQTKEAFSKLILGKYPVSYYQCKKCKFIQTEDPYWLEEAYSSGAISALDTGILSRNLILRHKTQNILPKLFKDFTGFYALDYGGGEGIFVRMMRDLGYNFYRHDLYADNLYARFFDLKDVPRGIKFDILTTFEVFEHLVDPITEIQKMLTYSDIILFSTELQPSDKVEELESWWYIVPETGQHISFYNELSLEKIAELLGLKFYTDHTTLHILSKSELKDPFEGNEVVTTKPNLAKRIFNSIYKKLNKGEKSHKQPHKPSSLTMQDFEFVKEKLNKQNK